MGIGYNDSIILYNRYEKKRTQEEYFYGTRFDGVRVELTQGEIVNQSGAQSDDVCVLKIDKTRLPKPFKSPKLWLDLPTEERLEHFTVDKDNKNFFVIVKKEGLDIDLDLPVGEIDSSLPEYQGGFYQYIRTKYGNSYLINKFRDYDLIPHFEIGGS